MDILKSMRPLKTGFLAFTFTVIASTTGGLLTACSNTSQSQNQPPTTSTTDTVATSDMGHGSSMNHSMAMDLGSADTNYDLRFVDAMMLHHQGAVSMAKEAQQKSQRPEIKQLADNIIQSQSKEINQLQQWRSAWYPQASNEPMAYGGADKSLKPMSEQQRQSMKMSKNLGSADAEFDLRFINEMIAHHESAITMAQDALSKSQRPEIKDLAQDIVAAQQAEIEQMKQWRQAWYKK